MSKKYSAPAFLVGIDPAKYERWLRRKAAAHLKRDRARGNMTASGESYRMAIHEAVVLSRGLDAYTGQELDWSLISTYDNEKSKEGRRAYKAKFALLPSVDHRGEGLCAGDFAICGWRTNDAKNDLSHAEFVELCRAIIQYHDKGSE